MLWVYVSSHASQTLQLRSYLKKWKSGIKRWRRRREKKRDVWGKQRHPPSFLRFFLLYQRLFSFEYVWEVDVKLVVIVSERVRSYVCVSVSVAVYVHTNDVHADETIFCLSHSKWFLFFLLPVVGTIPGEQMSTIQRHDSLTGQRHTMPLYIFYTYYVQK